MIANMSLVFAACFFVAGLFLFCLALSYNRSLRERSLQIIDSSELDPSAEYRVIGAAEGSWTRSMAKYFLALRDDKTRTHYLISVGGNRELEQEVRLRVMPAIYDDRLPIYMRMVEGIPTFHW